jgi:hypothetical protein
MQEPLKAKCVVVWTRTKAEGSEGKLPGMGVKFCEITEKNVQRLRDYIEKIKE